MTADLFENLSLTLSDAFTALRKDLIHPDGPSISTMRNYRFAILQYQPADEFKLRAEVQRLSSDLMANGWVVLTINLQRLLLDRVRAQSEDWMHRVIAMDMAGHGGSLALPGTATLEDYVAQARRLLDDLGITAVNVVGHSMGGLVAMGLAIAHPQRVRRLAVLNSVHERSPEARAAVEARAAAIAPGLSFEPALDRWFDKDEEALRERVRHWLERTDLASYATAYRIFATSDRDFTGRLSAILCPALFATGDGDPNATPAMAEAMALPGTLRRAPEQLRQPGTPQRLRQLHDGGHHRDDGGD